MVSCTTSVAWWNISCLFAIIVTLQSILSYWFLSWLERVIMNFWEDLCVFKHNWPNNKTYTFNFNHFGYIWAYTAKSKINQGVCFISTLCILFKTTMVYQTRVLQWKICIYNMTNFPVCYQQEIYFSGCESFIKVTTKGVTVDLWDLTR